MSRKNRMRQERRAAAQRQVPSQQQQEPEVQEDEVLDPADVLAGDAAFAAGDDIEDQFADGGEPAAPTVKGDRPATEDDDDPIAALQRQYDEAQAARKAAEDRLKDREAAEATLRAEAERDRSERAAVEARWRAEQEKRYELEAHKIKADRETLAGHKAVLEHAYAAADGERLVQQRRYAEAMAAMDYAAAAEAQSAATEAVIKRNQIAEGYERLKEQIEAPLPEVVRDPDPAPRQPAPVADPWEAAIAGYSDRDKQWLRAHKDDLNGNNERQLLAQAAHQTATLRYKLAPGTDDYYDYMDEHMGYAEPEDDGGDPEPAPVPVRQQAPRQAPQPRPKAAAVPSAPPSRSNQANGTASLPYLNREQKETAAALGMSFAKYAKYLQDIEGGKYHVKFSRE